jgi:general secretion pathway protein M
MNAVIANLQQTVGAFWEVRSARERKQIGFAIGFALCALVYALFISPALSGTAQLKKSLPDMRLQSVELQNLAKEAMALSSVNATPANPVTREIIEATLASKGLKAQSVAGTGDAFKVQFSAVSFAGLVEWLDEMQKNARVTVVDANMTSQGQTDIVNATLTLRQ